MSAVCGGNESVQKIILPESSRSCISSNNTLSNLSARVVDEVVQPSDTPAANRHTEANGTYFDLLENEEEERLLSDLSPLHVVDNTRRVAAAGSPKKTEVRLKNKGMFIPFILYGEVRADKYQWSHDENF
ncbi:hypothetical protein KIN20_030338 [Parelaphostrongylus tenuis]|uniref:Uncharacterized protein n=1 Tax=Parelaphostrongylus tenuis TaxID=148309 RepID=A0AAD5R3Y0_PARTN|nr:hypothetical protein KIN20_030338 [Parelaphostrongylus tenuis]